MIEVAIPILVVIGATVAGMLAGGLIVGSVLWGRVQKAKASEAVWRKAYTDMADKAHGAILAHSETIDQYYARGDGQQIPS